MFKRLFFLSGIIAFILASLLMYFWYLPTQQIEPLDTIEMSADEVVVSEQDTTVAQ